MEVSALKAPGVPALNGRSPLLRLAPDERLIAMIRRGNQGAFEALVSRYQSRLLAFCRHMLGSKEDAEDVLQEVFAAAYNAINADERPINVRPWLYRIARNRSLNHLRRAQAIGVDSMDIHLAEHGASTADKVLQREEFRLLIADVQTLAETQRTALLLREIDALSYDQIAEAMETTIPSVKSLLVRARVGLAEAAEARGLSCDDVRLELAEVAEGLTKVSPPVRRHLKSCERCSAFQSQLKANNKALAMIFPVGAFFLVKKLLLTHLGTTASAGGGGAAAGSGAAATAGGVTAGGVAAGGAATGMLSAGVATVASKAAAGIAAAAIVTAGAVEVRQAAVDQSASQAPAVIASAASAVAPVKKVAGPAKAAKPSTVTTTAKPAAAAPVAQQSQTTTTTTPAPAPVVAAPEPVTTTPAPAPTPPPAPEITETVTEVTTLPATTTPSPEAPVTTTPPTGPIAPGEIVTTPPTVMTPPPTPPAGEGGAPGGDTPPAPAP